jgi:hypothetical protein
VGLENQVDELALPFMGETISLIHAETALLRMRKCCESISYMCVVASEIETDRLERKFRKAYSVGRLLNDLKEQGKLHFPQSARLTKKIEDVPATWHLNVEVSDTTDADRLSKIHEASGDLLHEPSLHKDGWPEHTDLALARLAPRFNSLRADHQWIWNRFWQHSIRLRGNLLFVSLGDEAESSQPWIIREEGLLREDLKLKLDPEYLADFSGPITWPAR